MKRLIMFLSVIALCAGQLSCVEETCDRASIKFFNTRSFTVWIQLIGPETSNGYNQIEPDGSFLYENLPPDNSYHYYISDDSGILATGTVTTQECHVSKISF